MPSPLLAAATADPDWGRFLERAVAVSAIIGTLILWLTYRRKSERVRVTPQPLEVEGDVRVTPKGRLFSADICDEKHAAINHRILASEHEIEQLWITVRSENEAIRSELSNSFQSIQRALGRIEGKLDAAKIKLDQS